MVHPVARAVCGSVGQRHGGKRMQQFTRFALANVWGDAQFDMVVQNFGHDRG